MYIYIYVYMYICICTNIHNICLSYINANVDSTHICKPKCGKHAHPQPVTCTHTHKKTQWLKGHVQPWVLRCSS